MRPLLSRVVLPAFAAFAAFAPSATAQVSVGIVSAKDNTLYESATGQLSNGAGSRMFSGVSGTGSRQRGLVEFDIAASVPAGAVITGATLNLSCVKVSTNVSKLIGLHAVSQEWGEGTSVASSGQGGGGPVTPGSATWLHTFSSSSFWTTVGGDFASTASASLPITTTGPKTWASTALTVADVQGWLDDPSSNHGWLLLSPENTGSKVFATREEPTAPIRPNLQVTYFVPFSEFGTGCPGTGGFTPTLSGAGDTTPGGSISVTIDQGLGGSSALLFLGLVEASIPVGFGCTLNVSPLIGSPIALPLLGVGAGNGTITLPTTIPAGAASGSITLQAFCIDGGVPLGASVTNGLKLTIP